ncbi:MAG: hypothetical protein QXK06_03875 [Candidatus Diapherotrites archaeon]
MKQQKKLNEVAKKTPEGKTVFKLLFTNEPATLMERMTGAKRHST